MRTALRILLVVTVLAVELYAVYAVLHPNVSPEYRAYYIDRSTKDWNPTHYKASPEDGIDFGSPGWPTFVRYTSGFSFREPWGRWTDATLAASPTIGMDRKFGGPLCIEFAARPAYSQRGKKLDVVLGNNAEQITLSNPDPETYKVSFADAQPSDTLEFRFEGKIPPNNEFSGGGPDGRRLGMQFIWLKILPSVCKNAS